PRRGGGAAAAGRSLGGERLRQALGVAAAGGAGLRKVDALDDQQIGGVIGERVDRLSRVDQTAGRTGGGRPGPLGLDAAGRAHEERDPRGAAGCSRGPLRQAFEKGQADRDSARAVQERAAVDGALLHLAPPTWVRKASVLTNAS